MLWAGKKKDITLPEVVFLLALRSGGMKRFAAHTGSLLFPTVIYNIVHLHIWQWQLEWLKNIKQSIKKTERERECRRKKNTWGRHIESKDKTKQKKQKLKIRKDERKQKNLNKKKVDKKIKKKEKRKNNINRKYIFQSPKQAAKNCRNGPKVCFFQNVVHEKRNSWRLHFTTSVNNWIN